jgi:uncharacterized membrane protein YobD (UPF0266 family)
MLLVLRWLLKRLILLPPYEVFVCYDHMIFKEVTLFVKNCHVLDLRNSYYRTRFPFICQVDRE